MVKMIAANGILAPLECTKFVFGRGSNPDPADEPMALPRPSSRLGRRIPVPQSLPSRRLRPLAPRHCSPPPLSPSR